MNDGSVYNGQLQEVNDKEFYIVTGGGPDDFHRGFVKNVASVVGVAREESKAETSNSGGGNEQ